MIGIQGEELNLLYWSCHENGLGSFSMNKTKQGQFLLTSASCFLLRGILNLTAKAILPHALLPCMTSYPSETFLISVLTVTHQAHGPASENSVVLSVLQNEIMNIGEDRVGLCEGEVRRSLEGRPQMVRWEGKSTH